MSKLSDYSKFDHLDDESDEEEHFAEKTVSPATKAAELTTPQGCVTKKSSSVEGRYIFEYNGQTIYEWEQTLEDVTLYVKAPDKVQASQIDCQITSHHLKLGIKGHDAYFLDEDTFGKVDTTESSWYLDDDGLLNIILIKAHRGETWTQVLRGAKQLQQASNPILEQEIQKQLMLERFQEENPGMDFRDADFNGAVPDPRTFMGGVKYK